jgi:hypothetical protein
MSREEGRPLELSDQLVEILKAGVTPPQGIVPFFYDKGKKTQPDPD